MNLRTLLLVLVLGMSASAFSQDEIDVTQLSADTKTFIFDNNKNTVKGYIYSELKAKTNCCGSDRIYLEVQIDPSGYVIKAKTLTGKNDCFKQSAADIVKNVKWNAQDFKAPKSVYFEIKPNIDCNDGRGNTYAMVPVTNNDLLDEKGNRLQLERQPIVNNTQPSQPTEQPTEDANVATNDDATKPAEGVKQPQLADNTRPSDEEKTSAAPTPKVTQPSTPPIPAQNTTSEDDLQRAKTMAEAYKAVQDAEMEQLKAQMAEKKKAREAEIAKQKQAEEVRQKKIAAREARRQELLERRRSQQGGKASRADDDVLFAENDDNTDLSSQFGDDDDDDDDQEKTEEDRLNDELERLRAERQKIEDERRRTDNDRRQAQTENDRYGRDLLRIEEEIKNREEEREQYREQQELDRLAADQRRIEDEKRKREDELQRVMDEIQRLRDEADQKLADLERQEQDLKQLESERTLREQEIASERIRREQTQTAELRVKELEIQANTEASSNSTGSEISSALVQALATQDSSDRYLELIRTVSLLEAELKRLQQEMVTLKGESSSNTASSNTVTPRNPSIVIDNSGVRATENDSWKEVDYKDPNAPEETYRSAPAVKNQKKPTETTGTPEEGTNKEEVPEYKEGKGYSPAASHKDTHANVAGPVFSHLQYGEGRDAMKKYITDKLTQGGVCGLAQTFAEVTVNPQGNVVGYKILKANTPLVMALLPPILQSLNFSNANLRFNQNSYIEFKADIICGEEKIDLNQVKPFVKPKEGSNNN